MAVARVLTASCMPLASLPGTRSDTVLIEEAA